MFFEIAKNMKEIRNMMKVAEEEALERPRQLQNLTATYEGLIKRDFPEFDVREFLGTAETILLGYFNSIENGELNTSSTWSPNLKSAVKCFLEDVHSKGEKHYYDDILIHKSCISQYSSKAGSKTIKVEIACEYTYGICKGSTWVIHKQRNQYKYQLEAVYIQDVSQLGNGSMKGHYCPSCGAPITQVGSGKKCSYCGTGIQEINTRLWVFEGIKKC